MAKCAKFISFIIFVITLNECGFAIRGNDAISLRFDLIQLNLQQPNSELARFLRRSLDVANVETQLGISAEPNSNSAILEISDEQIASRPVTFIRAFGLEIGREDIDVLLDRFVEIQNSIGA